MAQTIEHTGVISGIRDKLIQVTIVQQEACEACEAKGSCAVADKKEKLIELECDSKGFKTGDEVLVYANQSIGFLAILYAFVIPFMLILLILFIMSFFSPNEFVAGGVSVLALLPYYVILSLFEKKLKRKFRFQIRMN